MAIARMRITALLAWDTTLDNTLEQLTATERERISLEQSEGDNTVELTLTITHGDRMKAEVEGPAYGLTSIEEAPMSFTALWVWAALIRYRILPSDTPFMTFRDTLLEVEQLDDDTEVPPTMPAATNSPSPSPSTGHPSNSGSTPTSTTG